MDETMRALLMVAPNGARRTKADHPELPMTVAELARDASACRNAGAAAIHLHVRGPDGRHILDADTYREAIRVVNTATGGDMVVQITTEAVGMYAPDQQMQLVREVRPGFVSVAVRELMPDQASELAAGLFFAWMRAERIVPQFILYDAADVLRLDDLCRRGVIPIENPFVLYVLGRYAKDQESAAGDLDPFIEAAKNNIWPWMVCAFGRREAACIGRGIELGGHGRIGFENNLYLPDGTVASGNAAQVSAAAVEVEKHNRSLMTPDQLKDMLANLG